jgi:hypothetical protein
VNFIQIDTRTSRKLSHKSAKKMEKHNHGLKLRCKEENAITDQEIETERRGGYPDRSQDWQEVPSPVRFRRRRRRCGAAPQDPSCRCRSDAPPLTQLLPLAAAPLPSRPLRSAPLSAAPLAAVRSPPSARCAQSRVWTGIIREVLAVD